MTTRRSFLSGIAATLAVVASGARLVVPAVRSIYGPSAWLLCDGQAVAVADYPALFAVMFNTYGGDHKIFRVPDLSPSFSESDGGNLGVVYAIKTGVGGEANFPVGMICPFVLPEAA